MVRFMSLPWLNGLLRNRPLRQIHTVILVVHSVSKRECKSYVMPLITIITMNVIADTLNIFAPSVGEHQGIAEWWLVITGVSIALSMNNAVNIADIESIRTYLQKIIDKFNKNPKDRRFLNVINPPVYGKLKSDFFLPQDFSWEPTGAISQIQIIMPSPQVPSGPKDIHFRNCKAGQNAKDYV